MEKHEMMSLEDSGQLRDKIRFFEQELLKNHHIDPNLYVEYNVKRGLRDSAGKGVLTGLTEISDVNGYNLINGRQIPADGRLYYQGINVQDIISGLNGRRFGFEETIYLLIFGKLPDKEELSRFLDMMSDMEELGGRFVRDVVMKGTNANIMNAMQRCVLALYTYDDNPEDISPENVLRQSLELIAKLPEIAVYSYHAYRAYRLGTEKAGSELEKDAGEERCASIAGKLSAEGAFSCREHSSYASPGWKIHRTGSKSSGYCTDPAC